MVTYKQVTFALVTLAALTLLDLPVTSAGRNCRGPGAPPAPTNWNWTVYPNPNSPNQDQQLQCCRSNQSYVCDPNGLISQRQADEIDVAINNVYAETRCGCQHCIHHNHGYIIRVALMSKMVPVYPNSRDNSTMAKLRDAHSYAYQISRRWDMDGDCQESLLILYSRQDNILFTLTRSETRKKLTDSKVGDVSLLVRHHFNREDTIAAGIKEMIARYRHILERDLSISFSK